MEIIEKERSRQKLLIKIKYEQSVLSIYLKKKKKKLGPYTITSTDEEIQISLYVIKSMCVWIAVLEYLPFKKDKFILKV